MVVVLLLQNVPQKQSQNSKNAEVDKVYLSAAAILIKIL
jgi:hypothetical protein